jgi:predicted ATP-dependent endonuclease of OLD family
VHRWWSTTAGKTLSDFIKPFLKRVEPGMKAFVVKVEYITDYDEAKEPVVTVQVTNNPVGRTADEDNEFPQGAHLNPLRVAFEAYMGDS